MQCEEVSKEFPGGHCCSQCHSDIEAGYSCFSPFETRDGRELRLCEGMINHLIEIGQANENQRYRDWPPGGPQWAKDWKAEHCGTA